MSSQSVQVPQEFICPISHDIMTEPVIGKDGHTYEKIHIHHWLSLKPIQTSPLNPNIILEKNKLVDNIALRSQIEKFKLSNPVYHIGPSYTNQNQNNDQNQININPELVNLPIQSFVKKYKDNTFLVELKSLSQLERMPVHVVCVVDISGSMETEVEIINDTGIKERNGLSRLDITKHALKTILHTLDNNDYISIVTFSTCAQTLASRQKISNVTKQLLEKLIDDMTPCGSTNIWDGLREAIKIIELTNLSAEINSIFLLTDGEPQIIPPRGHEKMLSNAMLKIGPKYTVNTFGFTYSLDSNLLLNLGQIGKGSYHFIPDAGFVGTIFVNALSNLLLTCATHCYVKIIFSNDTTEILNIGSCRLNSSRQVIIDPKNDFQNRSIESIEIYYTNPITFVTNDTKFEKNQIEENESFDFEYLNANVRKKFVNILLNSLKTKNSQELKVFIENLENLQNKTKLVDDILTDAKGQGLEALSRDDWFQKWGRHYLPSLAIAHDLQICNNFKDKGVQNYTSELFENMREKIDEIFNNIPAPKPSLRNTSNNTKILQNMSSYNTTGNGCFAGECFVYIMKSDTKNKVQIKDVKIGDLILSQNNVWAKVTHILKTKLQKPVDMIVVNSDNNYVNNIDNADNADDTDNTDNIYKKCVLTPWHPIYNHTTKLWEFPQESSLLKQHILYDGEAMYDFVLENNNSVNVGGVNCITLGHNLGIGTDNCVCSHPYFGTQAVIDDLNLLGDNGYVTITQDYFQRDPNTNKICRIKKPDQN